MRCLFPRWRGPLISLALLSFVFTQLAVAAYMCPDSANTIHAERMQMGDGDCHRSSGNSQDRDDAQLCKAYCERGAQAKPSSFPDLTDLASLPAAPAPLYVETVERCARATIDRGYSNGPPLYLLNCVLRN